MVNEAGGGPQVPGYDHPAVLLQQAGPGSVRYKGWLRGTALTGGLPVGLLAVWAVVYVDVWGLFLFHSNTAEMQETQTSLVFNNSESVSPAMPWVAPAHLL